MKDNWVSKCLVVGIIFLFIGVAVAPSINSTVVKASDDLVEVTSQACGIQGFGNTTVKLTKQQYQNLEQYLVDFRARLNQTTTREEAVPIFKDAVVELNKYGLLPKGMSVEKAQNLVLGGYQNPRYLQLLDKIQNSSRKNFSDYENYLCLIYGSTSRTTSQGPFITAFRFSSMNMYIVLSGLTKYFNEHNRSVLARIFGKITDYFYDNLISLNDFGIGSFILSFNPLQLLSVISLGFLFFNDYTGYWENDPAHGNIYTIGLNGIKNWNGDFYGAILNEKYLDFFSQLVFFYPCPGALGFSGIKITVPITSSWQSFYFGFGLGIKVSLSPPDLKQ